MNFLQACKGIKCGKRFRRKDWSEGRFICRGVFGLTESYLVESYDGRYMEIWLASWYDCLQEDWMEME